MTIHVGLIGGGNISETHARAAGGIFGVKIAAVGGEFRKFPEFLSFFSLIPSSACATFSLFFCMPSLSSSGLVDPVGSDLLLPNPS
jgi:hypothetical protein